MRRATCSSCSMRSRSILSCSRRACQLCDIATLGPLLDYLAPLYAMDGDERIRILLAGGCEPRDLGSVVGGSHREAAYHPVAFGWHLFNEDVAKISEGSIGAGGSP